MVYALLVIVILFLGALCVGLAVKVDTLKKRIIVLDYARGEAEHIRRCLENRQPPPRSEVRTEAAAGMPDGVILSLLQSPFGRERLRTLNLHNPLFQRVIEVGTRHGLNVEEFRVDLAQPTQEPTPKEEADQRTAWEHLLHSD